MPPNNPRVEGVSRQIEGDAGIEARDTMNGLTIPEGMGIILRTAGVGKSKEEMQWYLDYLSQLWETVKNASKERSAPYLIYQESDVIKRSIRDMFDEETQSIVVEGNEGYQKAKNYMKLIMPKQLKKVKKYRDKIPLFFKENIEKKLFEIFLHSLITFDDRAIGLV